ncbi:MAG: CotH kinase family protein, partial [Candidatus Symbiothrix sp.]|nr:CotH kinase family protein [Candidatus Symbiothrix sp.]
MNKTILLGIGFLISTLSSYGQSEEMLFSPNGIAEVRITLSNGKQINDIKNEKNDQDYVGKVDATMVVRNSAASAYADTELYNGKIQIDGRGNTSWGVPKRPYNIDLVDAAGVEHFAALLDMPEADEWCLLAFWHDRSLMRIPLAMYLGGHMQGIVYAPRMRYVELWINDEYRGLYCLSEKIQRDKNRIDIKKLTVATEDQIAPRISGGYILEGSSEEKLSAQEKAVDFRTSQDINFSFKYPKAKNVTSAQREWIKNHINEFESVLWSNNYKNETTGYQKYIDVPSFIDWTILHEQSRGVDNLFHASIFVHKDRDKKLMMSAPWDFDLSYGNAGDRIETGNWIRKHRWFAR